eukprot:TRINITY_DN204_c0_g1_i2.p1 TRINITY_DN204_c0_g1~~TRINITY_DN204_c0_g1_i2.p1  ORF type:complete len:229 (-),score=23.50 TRINITY_DN204_c0_g1_i2:61-747(-)
MAFSLIRSYTPSHAVPHGFQNDGAGQVWLAVAHTPHGDIPCKAQGGTAWYSYAGLEHVTNNFSYVEVHGSSLVSGQTNFPPHNAVSCGYQNDGAGPLYAIIAHTPHGNIPGKGKPGTAWYAHCGREHMTCDFSWVVHSHGGHMPVHTMPVHTPVIVDVHTPIHHQPHHVDMHLGGHHAGAHFGGHHGGVDVHLGGHHGGGHFTGHHGGGHFSGHHGGGHFGGHHGGHH